eukprot:960010-Amphidinium_carterae.1
MHTSFHVRAIALHGRRQGVYMSDGATPLTDPKPKEQHNTHMPAVTSRTVLTFFSQEHVGHLVPLPQKDTHTHTSLTPET